MKFAMMPLPEKIMIGFDGNQIDPNIASLGGTEYIRSDIATKREIEIVQMTVDVAKQYFKRLTHLEVYTIRPELILDRVK